MKMLQLTEPLYAYTVAHSTAELPLLKKLRDETAMLPAANMQIPPEQGALMALLAMTMGAQRTLEIGVFTGYSSLCVAMALPDPGRIVACDISKPYTDIAQRYWQEAGVAHKIDLRLAPATDTLASLLRDGQAERFDLAFIDADKGNYDAYYEKALALLRPGGLVLVDNVLWGGTVVHPPTDEDGRAISALNEKIAADSRVAALMLPLSDGLTLARKK